MLLYKVTVGLVKTQMHNIKLVIAVAEKPACEGKTMRGEEVLIRSMLWDEQDGGGEALSHMHLRATVRNKKHTSTMVGVLSQAECRMHARNWATDMGEAWGKGEWGWTLS